MGIGPCGPLGTAAVGFVVPGSGLGPGHVPIQHPLTEERNAQDRCRKRKIATYNPAQVRNV